MYSSSNSAAAFAARQKHQHLGIEFNPCAWNKYLHHGNLCVSWRFCRRYLHNKSQRTDIVLGSVEFNVDFSVQNRYQCDFSEVDLYVNARDKELAITTIDIDTDKRITLKLIVPSVLPLHILSEILDDKYRWILETPEKIVNGTFKVNIEMKCIPKRNLSLSEVRLLEYFLGKDYSIYEQGRSVESGEQINRFFREVRDYQKTSVKTENTDVQHEYLNPQLRPYQCRAVRWMAERENMFLTRQNINWVDSIVDQLETKCGVTLHYNKYTRSLFQDPVIDLTPVPIPRGGIYADEMGLGKTVVVIALILNHLRDVESERNNEDYVLPLLELKEPVKSEPDTVKEENPDSQGDSKGSKRMGDKMYEGSPPYKRKKREFKCLCGNDPARYRQDKWIQCPECKSFQHMKCVSYKKNHSYFCPSCWNKQGKLVKSKATLIVGPSCIYHQWYDEIQKHVDSEGFKNGVFMYNGVKSSGFIQPSVLGSYDVVITTYEILRAEVDYAINESTRVLRHTERYLRKISPLTLIEWWRFCMDEAQMVESCNTKVNQMANKIAAVNRWSITGTPIQNSISDIYYLVDWLGVEPLSGKSIWNDLLYVPYLHKNREPLLSLMSKVFWRNTKEDVADELGLPEQTTEYHMLKFGPLEQIYYGREHVTTSASFADYLRRSELDLTLTLDSLDKYKLHHLLNPLKHLRQACAHPLAVTSGAGISMKKKSMSQAELHAFLSKKTKRECEEQMRKYLKGLNGLAGLFCLGNDWEKAIENYRGVLEFVKSYKAHFNVDKRLRIHTLDNLIEIVEEHIEEKPSDLQELKDQLKELEDELMQKATDRVSTNEKTLGELSGKVKELEEKFVTGPEFWWARMIHLFSVEDCIGEVIDKIALEFTADTAEGATSSFLRKISDQTNMEEMLQEWVISIQEARKQAHDWLSRLLATSIDDLAGQAADCHFRPCEPQEEKCNLCKCEMAILQYECNLFAVSRRFLETEVEYGAQTTGSWKAHNAERVLKVIMNFGRTKALTETLLISDGQIHIQLLEAMKKEFIQLRVHWLSLMNQAKVRDELAVAKTRVRFRTEEEMLEQKKKRAPGYKKLTESEMKYVIDRFNLESQKLKIASELVTSKSEFRRKFGTLLYLNNLGQEEATKADFCPVCANNLEIQWFALQCGHVFCIDCVESLFKMTDQTFINCPICREKTKSDDLSLVDSRKMKEYGDVDVNGEHTAKVEGALKALLTLVQQEPQVKVLIFSGYNVVLDALESALEDNGIFYRRMSTGQRTRFESHLQEFKDLKSGVTALLLPYTWGSKGLNLTEATHVFLMEPVLNHSEELQAIGRVHRMGQTKPTVVHRFLISNTIEEKIHAAVTGGKSNWDDLQVTLQDLKDLFVIRNAFDRGNVSTLND